MADHNVGDSPFTPGSEQMKPDPAVNHGYDPFMAGKVARDALIARKARRQALRPPVNTTKTSKHRVTKTPRQPRAATKSATRANANQGRVATTPVYYAAQHNNVCPAYGNENQANNAMQTSNTYQSLNTYGPHQTLNSPQNYLNSANLYHATNSYLTDSMEAPFTQAPATQIAATHPLVTQAPVTQVPLTTYELEEPLDIFDFWKFIGVKGEKVGNVGEVWKHAGTGGRS